jgi:hypothetical protein
MLSRKIASIGGEVTDLVRSFEFALQGGCYIGIKYLNGNICHSWYR